MRLPFEICINKIPNSSSRFRFRNTRQRIKRSGNHQPPDSWFKIQARKAGPHLNAAALFNAPKTNDGRTTAHGTARAAATVRKASKHKDSANSAAQTARRKQHSADDADCEGIGREARRETKVSADHCGVKLNACGPPPRETKRRQRSAA
jgi:hypothetical protein